jgi:hypothetical protein
MLLILRSHFSNSYIPNKSQDMEGKVILCFLLQALRSSLTLAGIFPDQSLPDCIGDSPQSAVHLSGAFSNRCVCNYYNYCTFMASLPDLVALNQQQVQAVIANPLKALELLQNKDFSLLSGISNAPLIKRT